MSERLSPLSERVRRLLGTAMLEAPTAALNGSPQRFAEEASPSRRRTGTGTLFEERIGKLSHVIDELRAVDAQREAELVYLRDQVRYAHQHARADLSYTLQGTLSEIDTMLRMGRDMLAPLDEQAAGSLFERMRARAAAAQRLDPQQREQISALIDALTSVREQLRMLVEG